MRLGAEDRDGVGGGKVVEEETILDPHGDPQVDWNVCDGRMVR